MNKFNIVFKEYQNYILYYKLMGPNKEISFIYTLLLICIVIVQNWNEFEKNNNVMLLLIDTSVEFIIIHKKEKMKHDSRCDHTNYMNEWIMPIQNLCRSSLSSFDPLENTSIIIIIHQTTTSSTLLHFYEKDGLLHSFFGHKYDISVSDSGEVYH